MHWIILGAFALLIYGYVTRNTCASHPANMCIKQTPINTANSVNTSGCRAPVSTIAAGVCEPQAHCCHIAIPVSTQFPVTPTCAAPVAKKNTPGQPYNIWPGPTLGGYIAPPSGARLVGNRDNGAVYQMQSGQLYYVTNPPGLQGWQTMSKTIGIPYSMGASWIKYVWWTTFTPHPPFPVNTGPDAGKY